MFNLQTARAQASALHEAFVVLASWIAAAVCAGRHTAGRLERPSHYTFCSLLSVPSQTASAVQCRPSLLRI